MGLKGSAIYWSVVAVLVVIAGEVFDMEAKLEPASWFALGVGAFMTGLYLLKKELKKELKD